jgi:hypothetical protein
MRKGAPPALGAHVAVNGGKNAVQQNLGSPHSGMMSTITKGDPMSRMMNQHGKRHSFTAPAPMEPKPMRSTSMRAHPAKGGLTPTAVTPAAPSANYAMASTDTEGTSPPGAVGVIPGQ